MSGRVSRYKKETFSVNGEFIILIVLIVSWVHAYIKTYQSLHFKHVNHISIKLGGKPNIIYHYGADWTDASEAIAPSAPSKVLASLNSSLCGAGMWGEKKIKM